MVWLDGLDIPLVQFLDAGFAETGDADSQSLSRPEGDALARYAGNLLPIDWKLDTKNSPVLNYPYVRTRESLETISRNGEVDACHGHKLRYVNPATGGSPMPTIGTFIQLLPAGFQSRCYRSTDSTVYSVVEGTGESTIGGRKITWKPRDIFVAPSWAWQEHHSDGDAVLFSFSDRPVQQALGLWREERSAD